MVEKEASRRVVGKVKRINKDRYAVGEEAREGARVKGDTAGVGPSLGPSVMINLKISFSLAPQEVPL